MERKPRLFILEGADCTGKTSLAKFLCNKLNAAYWHHGWSRELAPGMFQYFEASLDAAKVCLQTSGIDVVIDRHWPSEFVYAPIFRPEVQILDYDHLAKKARDLNVTYILCENTDEHKAVALYNKNMDKQHPYTLDMYRRIYAGYQEFFRELRFCSENTISYNVDIDGKDMLAFTERLITQKY